MNLIRPLKSKKEVNEVIQSVEDRVVVLRFGDETEIGCMHTDNIMFKTEELLSEMAVMYTVNIKDVPEYVDYFEITLIPATVFFFNRVPIKIDSGSADNTKFIGVFMSKQDFIDLVEIVYRGAMRGKHIVKCPFEKSRVTNFELLFKDF